LDGVGYSGALFFRYRINALAYLWEGNGWLAGGAVIPSGRQVTREGNINILNINFNFFTQQALNY
jgi:hypothetical protein